MFEYALTDYLDRFTDFFSKIVVVRFTLMLSLVFSSFLYTQEMTIVSAHRTPDRMFEYARAADGRGMRLIIAGAGGAAHLPGMVRLG